MREVIRIKDMHQEETISGCTVSFGLEINSCSEICLGCLCYLG